MKEFAQRVELKQQARVSTLKNAVTNYKKTEYRGREDTDFKEEDIESFKDIATDKETNK